MSASNLTPATVTWEQLQQQLGLSIQRTKPAKQRGAPVTTSMPGATLEQLMQKSCKDGERTVHLTQLIGCLLASQFDLDETIENCHQWNKNNQPPLEDDKVVSTCESILASDQRNHPERYPDQLKDVPLYDLQKGRIDRYLSTPPPVRRWLLKDLVVLGKVGAVVAPGGSSKSQWMLQLAVSVATGIALAEHWEVGETGGVIVLFAEDDEDEIHRRLHRIQNHLTIAGHGAELAPLAERLFIFSTIGTDTLLTKKGTTGEVSATVTVDRIAALARLVADLRLIVIDPGSRFRGGEENSNEDATRFVEALEKLAQQTGATVMLAHHANKISSSTGDVSQGASRGASALTDGLRWQMNLNRPTEAQATTFNLPKDALGQYVAATVTKTNYSAIPAPVLLERGQDGYLSAVSATQARQNVDTTSIVAILRVLSAQGKPMSARALEDQHGGVRRTLKMSKERVREMIKLAIGRGYLDGGDRKPLAVNALGAGWLRCFPAPKADAVSGLKSAPRKKTQ
jgi:RecA-family ATPase